MTDYSGWFFHRNIQGFLNYQRAIGAIDFADSKINTDKRLSGEVGMTLGTCFHNNEDFVFVYSVEQKEEGPVIKCMTGDPRDFSKFFFQDFTIAELRHKCYAPGYLDLAFMFVAMNIYSIVENLKRYKNEKLAEQK